MLLLNAMDKEKLVVIATGGTFDKVYYDALSDYRIGEPQIEWILQQAGVNFTYTIHSLVKKDSLDINQKDRLLIRQTIESSSDHRFLVIHGTDTMVDTARMLEGLDGKTIVLTGAMQPARFRDSDACFNAGFAIAAALILPAGVYIGMNGELFTPHEARKNRRQGRFEKTALES